MDIPALAAELVALLKARRQHIATVESCTGGLIAAAITSISGSSEVFEQGFITYSNAAKTALVGVPADLLETHGAVSLPVAASMAQGALITAHADIALSVTGIAGPTGGSAEKPVGMICFGLAQKGVPPQTQVMQFGAIGRDAVRDNSVAHALTWAIQTLKT